jgi:hypothetical protein
LVKSLKKNNPSFAFPEEVIKYLETQMGEYYLYKQMFLDKLILRRLLRIQPCQYVREAVEKIPRYANMWKALGFSPSAYRI